MSAQSIVIGPTGTGDAIHLSHRGTDDLDSRVNHPV
jgi:hypothetical protein